MVAIESFEAAQGELPDGGLGQSHSELRGAFRLNHLAPGTYVISIQAEGLDAWTSRIRVAAGKVSRGAHAVLGAKDESIPAPPTTEEFENRHEDPTDGHDEATSEPDGRLRSGQDRS